MQKRDALELKKRFKKDSCTISRMAGCYVDANHNKVTKLNEVFLNLQNNEFYKFLDVAKKTLSGTVGQNIYELSFPIEEEKPGGKQQFLYGLRASNLENEDLLDRLYDLIIENFSYVGNYLILIYHDTYDIMNRTTDKFKLDESEEVYEYLLVAICPVVLSKAGLGYLENKRKIGCRIRDWIVKPPEIGFLWPAFDDRCAEIHKVDYFVRNPKESHQEIIENVLGCGNKRTSYENKLIMKAVVDEAFGVDDEAAMDAYIDIQENILEEIESYDTYSAENFVFDEKLIDKVLDKSDISERNASKIKESLMAEYEDDIPLTATLVDKNELSKMASEHKIKKLNEEVLNLRQQLEKDDDYEAASVKTYDVVIRVKPEKASSIHSEVIDGKKYIMIPVDENECATVNGINTKV